MMFGGMLSLFSWAYISQPTWSCLRLFRQEVELAADFARPSAGSSSEARIAITARTTRSSINVKARANADCGLRIAQEEVTTPLSCSALVSNFFSRQVLS